jgi:D-aminoacyl-tRNA deacylase
MRFAIAYSKLNSAGVLIVNEFKKFSFAPQIPIIELKKETIYSDDLNEKHYPELKEIDFLVFASTHKSEKNFPSLCLHAPGNWRNAEVGGHPYKICPTSAFVLKFLFQELNKNYNENKNKLNQEYNITLEVTHHGPDINLPCCFIELGSNEIQWKDAEAAKIVAKTIISLQNYDSNFIANHPWIACIGIGGLHYCPSFNKIQLNSNYALSHIIPEYVFPVTESMLEQAEEKTKEQIQEIIIDWKGCGNSESRQKLLDLLKQMGYKYKRTSEVSKE